MIVTVFAITVFGMAVLDCLLARRWTSAAFWVLPTLLVIGISLMGVN